MAEKYIHNGDNSTIFPDEPVTQTYLPEIGRDLCRVNRRYEGKYGGYRIDILTENLSEREKIGFVCTVCEGIMKEACTSSSGEQLCLCCRNISSGKKTSNVTVRKMINTLKCCCPLIERGCEWLGTLEDCENHLDTCGYVHVLCKQTCGVVLRRNKLEKHEKETCSQRVVKCGHCKKAYKSYKYNEHLNKCPKMKVPCDLCDTQITREDMPQHLKHDCGMVQETCQLGCGMKISRNELKIHKKDTCVQREIQCNRCLIIVKFIYCSRHLEECPYMEVTCELCSEEKCRQDMVEHLKDYCPEKMLECPFVKYKCMTVIKRKNMDNHLEEKKTKHLGLKLTAMEDLISQQSEKITKQSGEITKQNGKITKQSEEIKKLKLNIEKQNIEAYTQNEEIKKLKENEKQITKNVEEKRNINSLFSINDITMVIWKIENVTGLMRRGHHYSVSKQYLVAGCSCSLKLCYNRELSIVFPGTTRKYDNLFITKCRIALDATNIIDCGKIEVKQIDLTRGCERTLTIISQESVDKYSKPRYPGDTQKHLTLWIYLTIQ